MNDLSKRFFTDRARAAEERAAEVGLAVLITSSGERPEREAANLGLFEEQRVRGVLISSVDDITGRLERLRSGGAP